ncbi:hypothetical protein D3C84_1142470 [compost metagenome]
MGWQVRALVAEQHPSGTAIFAAVVRHCSDERQPTFATIFAREAENPRGADI